MKQTQTDAILKHLRRYGSITPKDALNEYGCMRLGARIYDLKRAGLKIRRTMERRENAHGKTKTFARYWLE